jgi:hypothetical protein
LMQVNVQKLNRRPWTSTGAEWLGVEPPGRRAEQRHARPPNTAI